MKWTTIKKDPLEHYSKVFLRKIGHQGGGYAQWDGMRKVFLNDYLFGPHGAKPDEYEYLDVSPDSKGEEPHYDDLHNTLWQAGMNGHRIDVVIEALKNKYTITKKQ